MLRTAKQAMIGMSFSSVLNYVDAEIFYAWSSCLLCGDRVDYHACGGKLWLLTLMAAGGGTLRLAKRIICFGSGLGAASWKSLTEKDPHARAALPTHVGEIIVV